LLGVNGVGKTNILEGLSFLSAGKGIRGAPLMEIGLNSSNHNKYSPWAVSAEVRNAFGSVQLGTGFDIQESKRRSAKIDGKKVKSPAAFAEHMGVVWVTPSMDRIFLDTPGERRRFLDRMVSAFDPGQASRLFAYEQAARRWGKLFRDGVSDSKWYKSLEDILVRYGVAIAAARRDLLARLNGALLEAEGPFPNAIMGIDGKVDRWLDNCSALDVEDLFREDLEETRLAFLKAGDVPVLDGPNRSDLVVVMGSSGRPAHQCSTGEQKALLLSIVLAHVKLQTLKLGYPPLLLFDEAAAHLDEARRSHLFERVISSGAQAWFTGTDCSIFSGLKDCAQFFLVDDNSVIPFAFKTDINSLDMLKYAQH
jgi:DNA replication and repair protein RecF